MKKQGDHLKGSVLLDLTELVRSQYILRSELYFSVYFCEKSLSLLIFFLLQKIIGLVYVVVQLFIFHTAKSYICYISLQTFVVFVLCLYFW